jgi:hypothetical protein
VNGFISDGQLLKNFHNELSHPILRILIGSKEIEIESESSLRKFIVKVHSTSRMWKFIVKVLGRFLLQNFHNELSLPIFRFPATFHTYKPSINLSNYSYNVGLAHEFADVREIVVDCRDCEHLMALRIGVYCYAGSC